MWTAIQCIRAGGCLAVLTFVCLSIPTMAGEALDSAQVFLVRHAEKETTGEDPDLSAAGRQRAIDLARTLRNAGINVIYSTDFVRTQETAAALAEQLGLHPLTYDWNELDALAAKLGRRGTRALVVGHSDTTPELVGLLGGDPGAPIDEPTEYDRLYLVTLGPDGTVTTVLLRYGR